jgi:prolyl-tRNA editing enzyme YbaK/EbsC (Cys-tRNA(Pro) deacylase)
MAKKGHVSETPATALLRAAGVEFTEHPYEYLEHGGAQHSAQVLGLDPFTVVKTLPEVANRHSGYLVGGTSPFGTRKAMPVYVEASILALPRIAINGGRRGYLVGLDPQVCVRLLGAKPVNCALEE